MITISNFTILSFTGAQQIRTKNQKEDFMPPNMNQEETTKPLEKFGTDITALAREGKLDPVIGRFFWISTISKDGNPESPAPKSADKPA